MSEQGAAQAEYHSEHQSSTGKWVILVLALLFVAGSLYAIFDSRGRLDKLEHSQAVSSAQLSDLKKQIAEAEAQGRLVIVRVLVAGRHSP